VIDEGLWSPTYDEVRATLLGGIAGLSLPHTDIEALEQLVRDDRTLALLVARIIRKAREATR